MIVSKLATCIRKYISDFILFEEVGTTKANERVLDILNYSFDP